jgi:hypothetical protein
MKRVLVVTALLLLAGMTQAQESASYRLNEHVLNAGGHPEAGVILTSAGYRMTLDALGESVVGRGLSSASYRMEGSFAAGYPPPGEVHNLRFTDDTTLVWDAERSVGTYNLYRDLLGALAGLGYGQCEEHGIENETTTDPDTPAAADGYFYLVTASNRRGEEGSMGEDRPNPNACP